MELFSATELTFPVYQMILLLVLSTISLLYGRIKLALLINYLFTLYWGYFFNRDLLITYMIEPYYFITIYFGLGLFVAVMATIGFLVYQD